MERYAFFACRPFLRGTETPRNLSRRWNGKRVRVKSSVRCCAARLSAVILCCAGLCDVALPLLCLMLSGRLLCRPVCRISLCCLRRLLWHCPATERSREKTNSGAEGARKTMSKGSEHVRNMCPETRANEPPEAKNDSKMLQNLVTVTLICMWLE